MSAIGAAQYISRVRREVDTLTVPTGLARRADVRDLEYVLQRIRNGVVWIDESVSDGSYSTLDGIRAACERARQVTSFLYATGADHQEWRHWAALSSFGLLLVGGGIGVPEGELIESLQYSLLAGEWQLAAAMPDLRSPTFNRYAHYVVWTLASGQNGIEPPWDASDDSAEAWRSFGNAMVERHPNATVLALDTVAELHIDTYGDDWNRFEEWSHPLFDLVAGAAAALARHRGLVSYNDFRDPVRCYLDPGLATSEPAPLYPSEWPEPSVVVRPQTN